MICYSLDNVRGNGSEIITESSRSALSCVIISIQLIERPLIEGRVWAG